MSDADLRELERRWREAGSREDEAAWIQAALRQGRSLDWDGYLRLVDLIPEGAARYLRERLQAGLLPQERLELASWCRHEPAALALGSIEPVVALWDGPYRQLDPAHFSEMLEGLEQFGSAHLLRGLRELAGELCLGWGEADAERRGQAEELAAAFATLSPGSEEALELEARLHALLNGLGEHDFPRSPVAGKSLTYVVLMALFPVAAFHARTPDRVTDQRVFGELVTEYLSEMFRRLGGLEARVDNVVTGQVAQWALAEYLTE